MDWGKGEGDTETSSVSETSNGIWPFPLEGIS